MAEDYQELSNFAHAHASDPLELAKILTAWQWAALLPGGYGTPPVVPQDVPTVLNASCGWREWLTTTLFDEIGIQERQVNFYDVPFQGGHTCLELYIDNKWMFFDPTFGIYFESKNGGDPLSIEEARANWPDIVVKQCAMPGWQGDFVDLDSINPATAFKTVTDPFLYDPASFTGVENAVGGELWSLYFGPNAAYYDGSHDTFLPSDRTWVTTEDTDNSQPYLSYVDNYDAAHHLDFRYGFNDDGSTFFIDYDQDGAFAWSTKTTHVDSHGVRGITLVEYDNGTHGYIGTPAGETITGDATNETFFGGLGDDTLDGAGGVDVFEFSGARSKYVITGDANSVTVSGPDGTDVIHNGEYLKFSDQVVPLTANTVTQTTATGSVNTSFDADGHRLQVTYDYHDGSGYAYQYDSLSQFSWNTVETSFDPDSSRSKVVYNNDDNTQTVYNYDVANAYNWSSVETDYNASGQRNQILYTKDDFTKTVYDYDVANANSWSSVQTDYNSSGQRSQILYTNDDHTAVLYQYDVSSQYTWSSQTRYFDEDGHKTKDVYDNDTGSHTLYEYDVAGNVTATHQFDASWHLIA